MNGEGKRQLKSKLPLPTYIQFETNTACNAHCSFCPHDSINPPRPAMPDEVIDKIINELVPTATDVCPFLMQEPCLEPRLPSILQKIKRANWRAKTWIYTTGRGLTEPLIRKLVDDGCLDQICFSYAGSNEEGRNNIERLIRYRGKRIYAHPEVEVHVIAMPKMDKSILDMGQYKTRYVPFDTFHGDVEYTGDKNALFDVEKRVLGEPNKSRTPCPRLWNTFNIHSNGIVVPCCVDWEEKVPIGNINAHSAEEIWNCDVFNELRELHIEKRWDEIQLCKNCTTWRWMK
jgi:radical SAM protein with 4Fe4S-binding SPASM domain